LSDIKFTKAQGMGNDFLIIDVEDVSALRTASELAREMCQRNYGAGADGIVFVTRARHEDADFASRIFNADGSEAGVSGNGTRCAAAYLYHAGLWSEPKIRIGTAAGVKHGRLVAREGNRLEFEFDMGRPDFSSEAVPMSITPSVEQVLRYPLHLGGDMLEVTCMSMGNPQCIIFVADLNAVNLEEIGPLIEDHPIFPDRANVEFVRVISRDEIEIRIWERGAGHTLSSGTGSCASAVAAALNDLTARSVRVRTEGGTLRVDWREDNNVMLTASAEVIYEGRWLRGVPCALPQVNDDQLGSA
jgi:diaminopimelate epimerase